MDLMHDPSQWERARAFGAEEAAGSVIARDRAARWDGELFRRLGAAGLLGAVLPRAAGGEGLPVALFSELLRGFGEGSADAGLALAWVAHLCGCAAPLWQFGTDAQRRRFLPLLARGDAVGAFAHHEQLSSPDATGIRTVAVHRDGRWVLSGTKSWVVNGPVADVFVVTAVTDPDRGKDGVSSFLIERSAPGLSVGRRMATPGLRTAALSELVLDGCEVPDSALLGAAGTGLARTCRVIHRWERASLFAPWVGFTTTLLARCVRHARERFRFSRRLCESQTVRAALADMRIRSEISLRMQARSAWQLGRGEDADERDLAIGALYLATSAVEVTRAAVKLLGLAGIEGDVDSERLFRDAAVIEAMARTADVLRPVVAADLVGLG